MKIVFASNNKDKLKEIRSIFNNIKILSLKDVNCNLELVEDKETIYENALKKAQEIYNQVKIPVIADDSGLFIKELNMWPGVMTKRFFKGSDFERNLEIIKKTNNTNNKEAFFRCSLVYYDGINILEGKGEIEGKITTEIRGNNGFGFDPIFELKNGKTLAELSSNEKNNCSARYLASLDLKSKLLK